MSERVIGKTCGECALWKTEKCPWLDDAQKGTQSKTGQACGDFIQGAKQKQNKRVLKDSGHCGSGYFEAVYQGEKPYFLLKSGEDFRIIETAEVNGETFHPKEVKHVPYEPYGFYEGPVPNREKLFWKVYDEFKTFVDVEDIYRDVLAACVLLTYHQEKLQTVPYIFLYGDNESGKSTVLGLLKFLCYRPMYGVTVPSADLYGYLEDSDSIGTILEDEIQGINKDTDKIKIYKAGYKRGAVVPRTIITQHDRFIKYYGTFGFKACASEQIVQVKGFNERFVFIAMVEGYPLKEWADLTKEDLQRLHNLRNMLLKWRLLAREWDLPNVELSMKGRLKELWKPILRVTSGLAVYDELFKFVEDQKKERLSSKQNTLEGHIVKVITELYNKGNETIPIPFPAIWWTLVSDLDGKLDDKKPHVMDTSEFFQVTKNKIGYRLREVLSGKSKPMREKNSEGNDVVVKAYEFDPHKLRRVAKKYGYNLVTKLLSEPSSEGVQAPQSMEKPDENNVKKGSHTPQQLSKLSNSVTSIEGNSLTENKESIESPRTEGIDQDRVCGHCALWHKPGCSFPEGEPDCVLSTNRFAIDCRSFYEVEEAEKP